MNNKSVVIFDFDGTIADTASLIEAAINELSEDLDFKKIKKATWEKLRDKEAGEAFKMMGISLIKLPFVLKKVRKMIYKEVGKIEPIKGMKKALFEIKKESQQIGILTSSSSKTVEKFLEINSLNFFDFVCSEKDIFNKAKKLKALLKKKKLDPERVFYVGDETRDIKAAKEAGAKTVAVSWGFNSEKILKKQNPDYLVGNPDQLIAIFKNL